MRLSYVRSSVGEGLRVLAGVAVALLGMGTIQYLLFPRMWRTNPGVVVAVLAVESFFVVVGLSYALWRILHPQRFVCRLDGEYIECVCPVKACGDTFRLAVAEIAKIEHAHWGETHRWYLWDRGGGCYWLTANYGNPAGKFIEALLRLRSDIVQEET